jgi:hypothetical protein
MIAKRAATAVDHEKKDSSPRKADSPGESVRESASIRDEISVVE